MGVDAARTRLPHALVRQVAPHPRRQPLDAGDGPARRSSATGSRAAPTPRPTGRPARAGAWIRRIADQFEQWFPTVGDERAVVHDRLVREPPRHRLVVQLERSRAGRGSAPSVATPAAAQLRDPRTADRRTASHGCSARCRKPPPASFGPVPFTGPEAEVQQAWLPFLDLYMKLQLEVDEQVGRVLERAGEPPAGRGEHRDRVHLRPRRVRRLARPARQGRGRVRGGHQGAADRLRSPRQARRANPNVTRTQLTSSVDVAPLLLTIAGGSDAWRAQSRYATSRPQRSDLAGILADPPPRAVPTCCTPPMRP